MSKTWKPKLTYQYVIWGRIILSFKQFLGCEHVREKQNKFCENLSISLHCFNIVIEINKDFIIDRKLIEIEK